MEIKYEIVACGRANRHRAARLAVFTPTLGRWWEKPEPVPTAFAALRKRWYAQLGRLSKAGWLPLKNRLKLQYTANCPPFSAGFADRLRGKCCNYGHVCPFCWGRLYAYKGFRFLEKALYGGTDPNAEPFRGVALVEAVSTAHYVPDKGRLWTVPYLVKEAWPRVARFLGTRGNDAKRQRARAAVTLFRVNPIKDGLTVVRATLALTDRPKQDPPDACGRVFKVHRAPTRHILAGVVGRAFAYPAGMLYGDAAFVVALLDLLHRRRLFTTYGQDTDLREVFRPALELAAELEQAGEELEGMEIPNLDDDVIDDEGAAYRAAEEEYQ